MSNSLVTKWQENLKALNQNDAFASCGSDEVRVKLAEQLEALDQYYPGGVSGYIGAARKLLKDSKEGKDPFAGLLAHEPAQTSVKLGSPEHLEFEKIGLETVGKLVFVLVAGGLGERLGYPDIKVKLITNMITETSYLENYCSAILMCQRISKATTPIPFFIMTSADTHTRTQDFLEKNSFFGLKKEQVILCQQEMVAALKDSDANIAIDPERGMVAKPHGHGDVHSLIYKNGLAKKWRDEGREWLFFFQDTNVLAMRALPTFLGISKKNNYACNFLAIPRLPKENVGGICTLKEPETGHQVTCNVEYNQLDALLKSQGFPGDVAREGSNLSPYPGNCNILCYRLDAYLETLEVSKGNVPEFVNPKYADAERNAFKSPTRIECMMQDLSRLFKSEMTVGCTVLERWFCFSTVKNSMKDAIAKLAANGSPEAMFTAEADYYHNCARTIQLACESLKIPCSVDAAVPMTFQGLKYNVPPHVVISPGVALAITQMADLIKKTGLKELTLTQALDYAIAGNEAPTPEQLAKILTEGSAKASQFVELTAEEMGSETTPLYLRSRGFKVTK